MPTLTRMMAQRYWERGWSVIPIEPHGKKPLLPWKPYQTQRATPDELDDWFADDGPNLGIVTGQLSGLAVLDVDSPDAMRFALSFREGRGLGDRTTPLVFTGKGYHVYYAYPTGLRNLQADPNWPGIDLRAEGGYVVAPPSVHASGRVYQWALEDDRPLNRMPQWMIRTGAVVPLPSKGSPVTEGQRNMTLARLAGSFFAANLDAATVLELCRVWNARNPAPLDDQELRTTVTSIQHAHVRNHPSDRPFEGLRV